MLSAEPRREFRGIDGFALACRRAGQSIVSGEGYWWREVAHCFFRPLLPYVGEWSVPPKLPRRVALGGCQYPSSRLDSTTTSALTYVSFPDAAAYHAEGLRHKHRAEIRAAQLSSVVRRISNADGLKAAHPLYVQFHARTGYGYLAKRVRKPHFDRWVDAEFSDPGLVVLGAWRGESLVAVSLSRVVGRAWLYSSFFSSDDGLRSHSPALMLHEVRCLARDAEGVDFVFAGMQKFGTSGASVDSFYLHRGAVLVRRPAALRVNPLTRIILSRFRPDLWSRLRGFGEPADSAGDRLDRCTDSRTSQHGEPR
jgi:hypothetical protein